MMADLQPMIEAGKALLGSGLEEIAQIGGGGNNLLLRVRRGGEKIALKFHTVTQPHRFDVEWRALSLLSMAGLPVPCPLACDATSRCIAYRWIEGSRPAACGPREADTMAAFLSALEELRDLPEAAAFGPASAAAFSPADIARQFADRLARLTAVATEYPDLAAFLERELAPVAAGLFDGLAADPLPSARRILSPSDFGIHNCLRGVNGSLAFLDFEYFGWDDPVKTVSDALLHPGGGMTAAARARFVAATTPGFGHRDPEFAERLRRLAPLYGMIWSLIILNEFLPEFYERRITAGQTGDLAQMQAGQLRKAREKLAEVRAMLASPGRWP